MSSVIEKIARLFGGREACEAEARKCGLVVRESKLGGMEFLLVFTHGFCNVPDATLDQMSQFLATACGVKINPQSVDERIRGPAVEFLRKQLETALAISANMKHIPAGMAEKFDHIYIIDSTNFKLHKSLAPAFKGSSGAASASLMRIQFAMDFRTGIMRIAIGDVRMADTTTLADWVSTEALPSVGRTLHVADLGYFRMKTFEAIASHGAFVLSKVMLGTKFVSPHGLPVSLPNILRDKPHSFDIPIAVGDHAFRLVGRRLPEEQTNRNIQRAREKRRKDGRVGELTDECKLLLCYLVFITNLPMDEYPVESLLVIYKARWQIELVFKTWKSLLGIHKIRSAKEARVRCEVYGKLIMAVIITAMSREAFLLFSPKRSCRMAQLSIHKAINRAKSFVLAWSLAIPGGEPMQKKTLLAFMRDIRDHALKSYCKKKPSTEMMMDDPTLLFASGKYAQIIA